MESLGVKIYTDHFDLVNADVALVVPTTRSLVITSGRIIVPAGITVTIAYSRDGTTFANAYVGQTNNTISLSGEHIQQIRLTVTAGSGRITVVYGQGDNPPNASNVPTSSAIADDEATPTTTGMRAYGMGWDGSAWSRIRAGITALTTSVKGWANVLSGIRYNATLPTATEAQFGVMQGDQNMRLWVREGYAMRAENNPLGVLQVLHLPVAASDGSWTGFKNLGANATLNIKSIAGNLNSIYCRNKSGSAAYLQIFNTATTPSAGNVPDFSFLVPAGGSIIVGNDFFGLGGIYLSNGMAFAWSSTETTYTAATAADHTTNVLYK